MTSAEKKLQIINMALSHLGQTKITQAQLDAVVIPSAVSMDLFYEPCRDEVLGESPWPFATVTETLSAVSSSTLTDCEYSYIYTYPTSTVSAIWYVFNEATFSDKEGQEFVVKYVPSLGERFIFSNLDEAIAEYSYKVTNPLLWSFKFIMAFSYRLAAETCVSITGDTGKAIELMNVYNAALGEAKRVAATERVKKPKVSSKYIESR